MKTTDLKVTRIGNSRGVRLPADTLRHYRIGDAVVMRERADGILLQPVRTAPKMNWEETAEAMAAAGEEWRAWEAADADGLGTLPWDQRPVGRVAEEGASYGTRVDGAPGVLKRYDIHWTVLDPASGAEMTKTRPAVIVSLDALNARLQTVTICPLTSQLHASWRSRVPATCDGTAAEIAVDQIRTVSKARLGKRIGRLNDAEAASVRRVITEMYGEA
jgi:mRNA interferase MazF